MLPQNLTKSHEELKKTNWRIYTVNSSDVVLILLRKKKDNLYLLFIKLVYNLVYCIIRIYLNKQGRIVARFNDNLPKKNKNKVIHYTTYRFKSSSWGSGKNILIGDNLSHFNQHVLKLCRQDFIHFVCLPTSFYVHEESMTWNFLQLERRYLKYF